MPTNPVNHRVILMRTCAVALLFVSLGNLCAETNAIEASPSQLKKMSLEDLMQLDEYKLKAVYRYNFVKYVDWPTNAFADEQSPLIIGVLGADPFGDTLKETVAGEVVKNRKREVRHYRDVSEIENCHVLFINSSESGNLKFILGNLKGRSILTVSDLEDFAYAGGMVRFLTENNKIRFRINVGATREADLSISAKLLQLAQIVSTERRP